MNSIQQTYHEDVFLRGKSLERKNGRRKHHDGKSKATRDGRIKLSAVPGI
jgi:hypothetical protein